MAAKLRYCCRECGHIAPRWMGRCPACGEWNTLDEEAAPRNGELSVIYSTASPLSITEVETAEDDRFATGIGELDRVLGGGAVPGSLILLGGDPGIGKSTLLLQVAGLVGGLGKRVLYASGEESVRQVRLRAGRLGVEPPDLYLLTETNMDRIEQSITDLKPDLVIVDSIQTVFKPDLSSAPGSVAQVRDCTAQLMRLAKTTGITVIIVGHVTKEGALAGPRVLEHMVDTVLYFEGERHQNYRILRCVKNRFGSTNEIGIYEMGEHGLREVINPSALFLMRHPRGEVPGSVVVPTVEGTRPLLVEIQALVCPTGFGMPRRMTTGVDHNRVAMIMAVLEKRLGLSLGACDAYVNVVGGVRLDEPAVDLGIAVALVSSFKDVAVYNGMAMTGEIGLTGEIRPVTAVDKRVREAAHLGFAACIVPGGNMTQLSADSVRVIGVETLEEALEQALMA